MISRFFVSSGLALLALYGATAPAFAASDRDDVLLGTGGVALALMAVLTLVYAVKWYFGLDAQPPAPEPDDHGQGNVALSHEDPEVEPPHGAEQPLPATDSPAHAH